jgi:hypothetical protein
MEQKMIEADVFTKSTEIYNAFFESKEHIANVFKDGYVRAWHEDEVECFIPVFEITRIEIVEEE